MLGWQIAIFGSMLAIIYICWIYSIGLIRASLALVARCLWLLPLVSVFFPKLVSEKEKGQTLQKQIHLLLDDSKSMPASSLDLVDDFRAECVARSCALEVRKLSEINAEVAKGYTPLNESLLSWMATSGTDPWVLVTDGGDSTPTVPWPKRLQGQGNGGRGIIASFATTQEENVFIKRINPPSFSFQDKPSVLKVEVGRVAASKASERIQLQAISEGHLLNSLNIEFQGKETLVAADIALPALPRGQHLIEVKVLPVSGEKSLWDNQQHAQLEVLANTFGVLHLLGSPNWDGRFMRRYLKSEPKFDLISFFILRDKWDTAVSSERELSLIPFPVKRLFEEELPNFKVVVVQNFGLFEFLEPQYQKNLVDFVKNGGSMLFIGGPRSLQAGDLTSSALSEILPFQSNASGTGLPNMAANQFQQNDIYDSGSASSGFPGFDPALKFRIELARPTDSQKSLASVFDDWKLLANDMAKVTNAQGLHRVDKVKFREGAYTPLLDAKLEDGRRLPLAVASYPGKGRAIWFFSDSLWRLALAQSEKISRQVYQQFVGSSFSWLLRDETRKPLSIRDFSLRKVAGDEVEWELDLLGPAVRHIRGEGNLKLEVCGEDVDGKNLAMLSYATEDLHLAGRVRVRYNDAKICAVKVRASSEAFGELRVGLSEILPERYQDRVVGSSLLKLQDLSGLTGANIFDAHLQKEDLMAALSVWMDSELGESPGRMHLVKDFFWFFDSRWFLLCLLFIPIEVIIRRWHLLTR